MTTATAGTVRNGTVIPDAPLPEGTRVEITYQENPFLTAELEEEFAAWDRASARALNRVEELALEMEREENASR